MTYIEKIQNSVETATGVPFLYHDRGELDTLIAHTDSNFFALCHLLTGGGMREENGLLYERNNVAVFFTTKTQYDFESEDNERLIGECQKLAYAWLGFLRSSADLRLVSLNGSERVYNEQSDLLTGFAVNVTLEDLQGVSDCDGYTPAPRVLSVSENGEYDLHGYDVAKVNVEDTDLRQLVEELQAQVSVLTERIAKDEAIITALTEQVAKDETNISVLQTQFGYLNNSILSVKNDVDPMRKVLNNSNLQKLGGIEQNDD